MKKIILCLSLLGALSPSLANESLPRDVQRFIDKREGCDHMRGEIPDQSEKERRREVDREIQKLCKGTDKDLAQLKKKYAKNASVMRCLDEFEPAIEAVQVPVPRSRAGHHSG